MQEERRISPAVIIIPVGLGLGLAAALGIAALARAAPPEEEKKAAATVKIEVIGAESHSPVTLTEGESYIVRLTVANLTTKAGAPSEATLEVVIAAGTEWVSLIPIQTSDEYFDAGQTRFFDYPMNVPLGTGGQSGNIVAVVNDPAGIELARATEYLSIAEVPIIYGATVTIGV